MCAIALLACGLLLRALLARSHRPSLAPAQDQTKTQEKNMNRKLILVGATIALGGAAVASAVAATSAGPLRLGPSARAQMPSFKGFYDGHKDTYLITDVSSKAQAKALHINYSPALAGVRDAPAQYFVKGRAAAGQLAVFGSEPGETSYNPLWEELFVTWNAGVKPVLLVKDDQITALAARHKLKVRDAHIVLNAPITKIG
jgi:hypothetical protein